MQQPLASARQTVTLDATEFILDQTIREVISIVQQVVTAQNEQAQGVLDRTIGKLHEAHREWLASHRKL